MRAMLTHLVILMSFVWYGCDGGQAAGEDIATAEELPSQAEDVGEVEAPAVRVPAEWEQHAATWMQWPGQYEATMRPAFADVIQVIQAYEPVHLVVGTAAERDAAEQFLAGRDVPLSHVSWHVFPVDNAWMRDNGPVYVTDGEGTWIQDWSFDAWGGNFGADVTYLDDDAIPGRVAGFLGIGAEDKTPYILERGNLEFNGADTLILGWDCQDDRNPGLSRGEHEAILTSAFGVTRIIWAFGHQEGEGTTGHIDGVARFIDEATVAVGDYGMATGDALAEDLEAAGFDVIMHPGDMNWLVGNGFIVAGAEGDAAFDAETKAALQSFFPGRDVHLIDVQAVWSQGGGIHCITNDQPAPAN